MNQKKLTVYTAITNQYDILRKPQFVSDDIEYICFSDKPFDDDVWSYRPLQQEGLNPYLLAKHPKILPHHYLPDAEVSVWVDANLEIVGDLRPLVNELMSENDMALFIHPERVCAYEEAEAIIRLKKDDPEVVQKQINKFESLGLQRADGMNACGFLIRNHQKPEIQKAMEMWWDEIENGSQRDQISFQFVKMKTGLKVKTIEDNIRDNKYLKWHKHGVKLEPEPVKAKPPKDKPKPPQKKRLIRKIRDFVTGRI